MLITKSHLKKLIKECLLEQNQFEDFSFQYGKFNVHSRDFRGENTFEFDTRNFHNLDKSVEILLKHYKKTGEPSFMSGFEEDEESIEPDFSYFLADFSNYLGDLLFKSFKSNKYISDWSFAGRSNGWFAFILSSSFDSLPEKSKIKVLTSIEDKFMKIKNLMTNQYEIYWKKFLNTI